MSYYKRAIPILRFPMCLWKVFGAFCSSHCHTSSTYRCMAKKLLSVNNNLYCYNHNSTEQVRVDACYLKMPYPVYPVFFLVFYRAYLPGILVSINGGLLFLKMCLWYKYIPWQQVFGLRYSWAGVVWPVVYYLSLINYPRCWWNPNSTWFVPVTTKDIVIVFQIQQVVCFVS